uniref:EIF5 domain containing protein n=1 Tax=Marseillevirus sp. TaxID=2809551 RepID=A0AA96ELD3_9VIRU|nr:eIF5 domain containing protein [Marseillevirus sp.]
MELVTTFPRQAKTVPINPDFGDDPFYRYKTKQLVLSFKNGKTFFENLEVVSKDLCVSAAEIPKFLSLSLGGSTGFDKKRKLFWMSGERSVEDVEKKYRHYLFSVVICEMCGQPELQRQKKCLVCKGCGDSRKFCSLDVDERFLIFLQKYYCLVVVPREEHRGKGRRRASIALHRLGRERKTIRLASHLVVGVRVHSGLEPPVRGLFSALGWERLLATDAHRIVHVPLRHVDSNHGPVDSIFTSDESLQVVVGVDGVTRTGSNFLQTVRVSHPSILVPVVR